MLDKAGLNRNGCPLVGARDLRLQQNSSMCRRRSSRSGSREGLASLAFHSMCWQRFSRAAETPINYDMLSCPQHSNPSSSAVALPPKVATWYISIGYTQVEFVQQIYMKGHEIATHTYDHVGLPSATEIVSARSWLNQVGLTGGAGRRRLL